MGTVLSPSNSKKWCAAAVGDAGASHGRLVRVLCSPQVPDHTDAHGSHHAAHAGLCCLLRDCRSPELLGSHHGDVNITSIYTPFLHRYLWRIRAAKTLPLFKCFLTALVQEEVVF